MRSQPKSPPERTPFSFLIRPAGMPRKPCWFRATSRSCRCRRVHPSSTARKTSGNSYARIGYQTGSLNPSTISSTTAATPGTHSSINPGRSCPSRDATGQQSVTQSEDWHRRRAAKPLHDALGIVGVGDMFPVRLVDAQPIEQCAELVPVLGGIDGFGAGAQDERVAAWWLYLFT